MPDQQPKPVLDPKQIYLKTPLYEKIELAGHTLGKSLVHYVMEGMLTLSTITEPPSKIESYCVDCDKESIFSAERLTVNLTTADKKRMSNQGIPVVGELREIITIKMECIHDKSHVMYSVFRHKDNLIVKIGQWPSISDLESRETKKYRKILNKEQYQELNKAVRLYSHGVGIGSFIYLRRIFERLVYEAYESANTTNKEITKEAFDAARMDERLYMLRRYLPEFLVNNYKLYSILSKGVHELSDEECLKHFEIVHHGIEVILDEILAKAESIEKAQRAEKAIAKLHSEIKKR